MRVDLPDPETPVTHENNPTGIVAFRSDKLFPLALCIVISFLGLYLCLSAGTKIDFVPERYWPVIDSFLSIMSDKLPEATTRPPWTPAPGPISNIKSAACIASSSCSTTITVLPKFFRLFSDLSNLSLSLWCRPIDGSSRM